MIIYNGTKEENVVDFFLKNNVTGQQAQTFKDKGIIKIDGVIHISDPYNILAN